MSALLLLDPAPLPAGLGISAEAWHQTPTSVPPQWLALLQPVEARAARLHRDSSTSSRPPSTAAPSTQRQRRTKAAEGRQPSAPPGPLGQHQVRVEPTASVAF